MTHDSAKHRFHVEYETGETEDFDVPGIESQARWDDLTDNGLHGRTDIAHAKWTAPGKNRPRTAGSYGIPPAERQRPPDDAECQQADREANRAEMDKVAELNSKHDRAEIRRAYYLRTGR